MDTHRKRESRPRQVTISPEPRGTAACIRFLTGLFFDGEGLSAVAFETETETETFRIGEPQPLGIRGPYWYGVDGLSGARGRAWDIDPTQDRFLMIRMPEDFPADGGEEDGDDDPARIRVVLNAFDELGELGQP